MFNKPNTLYIGKVGWLLGSFLYDRYDMCSCGARRVFKSSVCSLKALTDMSLISSLEENTGMTVWNGVMILSFKL